MKISQMREIAQNRQNIIGFLRLTEIQEINANLKDIDVSKMPFNEICLITFAQLGSKQIKKKNASAVFEVLMLANKSFKTELFRHNSNSNEIYQYQQEQGGYVFLKYGSQKEVEKLEKEFGKYVV